MTGFAGAQQTVSDVIVGRRRDTGKPWRGPLLPRRISPRITIADAMAKAVMVQGGVGTATAPSQAPLVTVHTLPQIWTSLPVQKPTSLSDFESIVAYRQ